MACYIDRVMLWIDYFVLLIQVCCENTFCVVRINILFANPIKSRKSSKIVYAFSGSFAGNERSS